MQFLFYSRLVLFFLGLGLLFVADRYLGAETYHFTLRIVAMSVASVGGLFTFLLMIRANGKGFKDEARCWLYNLTWQLVVLGGVFLYVVYSQVMGNNPTPSSFGEKGLLAAWLCLLTLGFFAGIGFEWSSWQNGSGELAESKRVQRSGLSWLSVGMLAVFLFSINYAANIKNKSSDWSYLKTTSPSQSTLALVKTATEKVEIGLFFPNHNEVKDRIADYFTTLKGGEKDLLVVNYFDKDRNPKDAEKFRVSRNGQVVLLQGTKRESIELGIELRKARSKLPKLDGEFQKAFLALTKAKKTAYFTRGHGELSWKSESPNPLASLKIFQLLMKQQNYSTKFFGLGDGSAKEVPDDAGVVVVLGPTMPFQKEEVDALERFVDRGGALMVFLDSEKPEGDQIPSESRPLWSLMSQIGIDYNPAPVANEKQHYSAFHNQADRWLLPTKVFTSHDSVINLARHEENVAVAGFRIGSLKTKPQTAKFKVYETIRSMSDSFIDENQNAKMDQGEKKDSYVFGAVAEAKAEGSSGTKGKVFAYADASVTADALIRNQGNLLFVIDSLKWLVGDSDFSGEIANEEDVKIRHTKKENAIYFHLSVVFVPILVLGAGFVATRRKKLKRV